MKKKIINLIFLAAAVAMGVHFQWAWLDTVFFTLFVWIILHPLPSRIFASGAIALLVATPFFLMTERRDIAEQTAIYAYYFLIFTVMMAIRELRNEKDGNN
ncbi:MAG: hypothetical protein HGB08_02085 [Candidatus Moranbacteria bacterium]|nr:hypothetical protein [Candidatus Moranbacteria bacterium]